MTAYYNEFDPYAAQWLRNLIAAGHIAPGDVDSRSIEDVRPSDLAGYTQCHFFAGIGVWSYALRRAGWADSRPVWTGSCPCQPFSAAGKGNGFADERHLWPAWLHLIGQRSPIVVFGEQVSSKDADIWVDLVQTDMEALGYAFGAVPFPSAGIGAPHIRDRLYWLADSSLRGHEQSQQLGRIERQTHGEPSSNLGRSGQGFSRLADFASNRWVGSGTGSEIQTRRPARPEQSGFMAGGFEGCTIPDVGETPGMATRVVGNSNDPRLEGFGSGYKTEGGRVGEVRPITTTSELGGLADSLDGAGHGSQPRSIVRELPQGVGALQAECRPTGPVNGRWSDADWLFCRDGKWRPVESGTFPLAHGAPARVGRLRAYGNAINAEAAEAFIRSYMECRP